MREHYTLARLYVPETLCQDAGIDLPQSQAHFLGKVIRKNVGDLVRVFNGADGEWLANINLLSKRNAKIIILEQLRPAYTPPDVWLLFAPVKKARNHFIVEKATELGVVRLHPIMTGRTTSSIKTDKMEAQIIEAAEQTERLDLPQVCAPLKLEQVLSGWDPSRALIFADEEGGGQPAVEALANIKPPCAIIIGPEGGFTPEERDLLRSKKYVTPISLGPRILRADTAALSTLAIWQAVSGDW